MAQTNMMKMEGISQVLFSAYPLTVELQVRPNTKKTNGEFLPGVRTTSYNSTRYSTPMEAITTAFHFSKYIAFRYSKYIDNNRITTDALASEPHLLDLQQFFGNVSNLLITNYETIYNRTTGQIDPSFANGWKSPDLARLGSNQQGFANLQVFPTFITVGQQNPTAAEGVVMYVNNSSYPVEMTLHSFLGLADLLTAITNPGNFALMSQNVFIMGQLENITLNQTGGQTYQGFLNGGSPYGAPDGQPAARPQRSAGFGPRAGATPPPAGRPQFPTGGAVPTEAPMEPEGAAPVGRTYNRPNFSSQVANSRPAVDPTSTVANTPVAEAKPEVEKTTLDDLSAEMGSPEPVMGMNKDILDLANSTDFTLDDDELI